MRIVIEVRSNRFPEIIAGMRAKAEAAVARAVQDAETLAKVNAPVDTGALRNSIMGEADGLEGAIYTGIEYSVYQEFGTYKMPAHPFFTPAIEGVAGQFARDMQDIFNG